MDAIRRRKAAANKFLNGPFFNPGFKSKMHCIQLFMVILFIALTGARIRTELGEMSVPDIIGIAMAIKTIVLIGYQLLTTHVKKLQRWRNLLVYMIINGIEAPLWFVVVIVDFALITNNCRGAYCGVSWLILLTAAALKFLAFWVIVVSKHMRRDEKRAEQTPESQASDQAKEDNATTSSV